MSAEWPLLQAGSQGAGVRALQRLLLHRGANVDIDGLFGPATEQAAREFQTKAGPAVDGSVGPNPWQALVVENEAT